VHEPPSEDRAHYVDAILDNGHVESPVSLESTGLVDNGRVSHQYRTTKALDQPSQAGNSGSTPINSFEAVPVRDSTRNPLLSLIRFCHQHDDVVDTEIWAFVRGEA